MGNSLGAMLFIGTGILVGYGIITGKLQTWVSNLNKQPSTNTNATTLTNAVGAGVNPPVQVLPPGGVGIGINPQDLVSTTVSNLTQPSANGAGGSMQPANNAGGWPVAGNGNVG